MSPDVSVVMAAYDAERYVEEAIDSVAAQSFAGHELIVVDDGSTDRTPAILRERLGFLERAGLATRLLRQDNAGLAAARNAGVRAANGRYVAFLDADDVWHPELLEASVAALESDPGACLSFPLYAYVADDGTELGVQSAPTSDRVGLGSLLVDNPIHSDSGVVVRAAAAARIGPFDEALSGYVGLDYWIRAASGGAGTLKCVPRVLVRYRRHGAQITSDWRRMEANWTALLAKAKRLEPDVVAKAEPGMRAAQYVYWSSLAYAGGDFGSARALIASAWRADPVAVLKDRTGPIRTLSCIASLLPTRLHRGIRERVARRSGAGRTG